MDDPSDVPLNTGARWGSAAAATVLMVVVVVYSLAPRSVTTVAPQCAGGDDCAVSVTASADPFVAIAMLALVALFGVMAVTGLPFSVMLGNGAGLTPVPPPPKVEKVRAAPPDATPLQVDESDSDAGTSSLPVAELRSLALWNALPADMHQPLLDWVAEEQGITDPTQVQLNLTEVSRKSGPGNHAFYVSGKTADGQGTWTAKLSRGGRGKREVSANHAS